MAPIASSLQQEHNSISNDMQMELALPLSERSRIDSSTTTGSSDNINSKDISDENDLEAAGDGIAPNSTSDHHQHQHQYHKQQGSQDNTEAATDMRGGRGHHAGVSVEIGEQWHHPLTPEEDHTNHQYLPSFILRLGTYLLSLRFLKSIATYLSGPPRSQASQPRLWRFPFLDDKIEKNIVRYTRFTRYPLVLWGFLLAWFLGTTFLARAAWWNAPLGQDVQWLDGTSTYWQRNDGCGLNGETCGPFEGFTASYRCPSKVASTRLLNYRAVGNEEVIYQPLVVGGGDEAGTYRADSFICSAAVHRGLFTENRGGCLTLEAIGNYTNFLSSTHNEITSVSFDSEFPFAYRFSPTSQKDCKDLRDDMLAFSAVMSAAFGILIRATAGVFYWVSVCFGFWHITLASDPRSFPPDLSGAFGSFLPCLFFCYAFYRFAYRWVLPAFNNRTFERTIWFYGPFWVFLLSNYTLDKIPIDRLTASDIKQQAGGIAAIVVLVIILVIVAINQVRVVRVTGWLPYYLGWYILGGLTIMVLALLPGLNLRIHHYIAAMCLIPATAFPTRLSLLYQGILLGLFLNGAARWGFDSILQTTADLRRDAALGSDLPAFLTTSFDTANPSISWSPIPSSLNSSWDGFALLINDVLRYTGTSTNFSLPTSTSETVNATVFRTDIPYYLRLAYTSGGSSGDFTRAGTAWLGNGTFIMPEAGPS